MSRVDEIKDEILQLQKELYSIQQECPHPESHLKKEAKSNTGNWDPHNDCYWCDLHCSLCDKRWSEDQYEYNRKHR